MSNANYTLICLLARNAPAATVYAVETTARTLDRLARRHLELCEMACNEPDTDGAIAQSLAAVERRIVNAAKALDCTARFETDPRGITVWIVGTNGELSFA